jgi:hypothetical protein
MINRHSKKNIQTQKSAFRPNSRLEGMSSTITAHGQRQFRSTVCQCRPGVLLLIIFLLAAGIPSTIPTCRRSPAAFSYGNAWIKGKGAGTCGRFLDSAAAGMSRSIPAYAKRMANAPRDAARLPGTLSLRGSNNEASAAGMQGDGGSRGVGR